jgi:sarcosine oxidase
VLGVTRGGREAAEATFGVRIADGEPAAVEPTAGVMWPAETRAALTDAARAAGADLREHCPVQDIDGLAPRTPEGVSGFDRIILAGGPWAFRLAPEAAGAFTITRRFQVVFRTGAPLGDGRPRPWIDHAGIGYYGMVNVAPGLHLVGLHEVDIEQPVDDPDEPVDEEMRAWSLARSTEYVRRRFGVGIEPVEVRICHYTSTPSRDFVIDDCPGRPGVILLSPCSGHGFKFGITVGEYAARLAHDEIVPDRERFRRRSATMN